MKVNAIRCRNCGDTVFSRARHDFRTCSCFEDKEEGTGVFIDGGFEPAYRTGGQPSNIDHRVLNVKATRKQLFDDWNNHVDKFGLIKGKPDLVRR